jgi:hypothetical protein
MSTVERFVNEISDLVDGYEASDEVTEALKQRELVPLIGPFAVGKSAIMHAAIELDSEFGRVQSFTTRSQRPNEDSSTYDFRGHNELTLAQIRDDIRDRSLVQVIVHPTTGNVYGSNIDCYGAPYSMLDTMPTSLPGLEVLPFRAIHKVAIAVPPEAWLGRLAERAGIGDENDLRKRVREGVANLKWSLDQGQELSWVVNGDRDIRDTADELISTVRSGGSEASSVAGRIAAEHLLVAMREIEQS